MEHIHHYILLAIYFINICIGAYVFLRNPKSWINTSFFLFIIGMSAWAGGISLLYLTHSFWFDKVALGGGLVMFLGLILFAQTFPENRIPRKRFWFLLTPLFASAFILPFDLFIAGISVDGNGLIQPINGPLFPLYAAISLCYPATAITLLIRKYKKAHGTARSQLRYLGLGLGLFISCVFIFDALLPLIGIYQLNLVGPATSLIFVSLTAYAIIRHQLMDIRIVVQRGAIYSAIFTLIVLVYTATLLALSRLIPQEHIAAPLTAVIVTLLGIWSVPHIERVFKSMTDTFFFKETYTYQDALERLGTTLNVHNRIPMLVSACIETLFAILKPEFVSFEYADTGATKVHGTRTSEAVISIPILSGKKRFGTIHLGLKRSGDAYTKEDRALLRTFALQATVAFQKATLYERLREHSKHLEQKVLERTQHLEELHSKQRYFMDDISHALQTPLTILKCAIENRRAGQHVEEENIERSVDDMSRLIRDLLALARLDTAPTTETVEVVDLSTLLTDLASYVETACHTYGIRLISHIQPGVQLAGSARQLEEAVTNVLSNAVRYTAKSATKEITLTLLSDESGNTLTITDTGPGIDPERLPHIFERMYRAQDHEGSGLGLAITRRIVEKHGGTVTATSMPGSGTTITISFPVTPLDRP